MTCNTKIAYFETRRVCYSSPGVKCVALTKDNCARCEQHYRWLQETLGHPGITTSGYQRDACQELRFKREETRAWKG